MNCTSDQDILDAAVAEFGAYARQCRGAQTRARLVSARWPGAARAAGAVTPHDLGARNSWDSHQRTSRRS